MKRRAVALSVRDHKLARNPKVRKWLRQVEAILNTPAVQADVQRRVVASMTGAAP